MSPATLVLAAAVLLLAGPAWAELPCRLYDTRHLTDPDVVQAPPTASLPLGPGIHGFSVQRVRGCRAPWGTQSVRLRVTVLDPPGPGRLTLYPTSTWNLQEGHISAGPPDVPTVTWGTQTQSEEVTVRLGHDWMQPDLGLLIGSPCGPVHMTIDLLGAQ